MPVRIVVCAVLAAAAGCFTSPAPPAGTPRHILLIRHAEKTGLPGDVHLSKKGAERADTLPALFAASADRPDPFPKPDFVFAASDSGNSHRPRETVAPLAAKLRLAADTAFDSTPPDGIDARGAGGLRDRLFGDGKYAGKVVLVAWRHSKLPELAKALRADTAPAKWADEVYDRVWQITYDDRGRAEFRDRPMRLLPGDGEK